jgi:hypothetical protein
MEIVETFVKCGAQSQEYVVVNGKEYSGWVHSKPINPRWWKTRIRDAWQILKGKAIAIQYFEDLTEEQKQEYIKRYWQDARILENRRK